MKSRKVAGRPSTDESNTLPRPRSLEDDDRRLGAPVLRDTAGASRPSTVETPIRCRD